MNAHATIRGLAERDLLRSQIHDHSVVSGGQVSVGEPGEQAVDMWVSTVRRASSPWAFSAARLVAPQSTSTACPEQDKWMHVCHRPPLPNVSPPPTNRILMTAPAPGSGWHGTFGQARPDERDTPCVERYDGYWR